MKKFLVTAFFFTIAVAAFAQSAPEAKDRVRAFLDGRADKVRKD